MLSEEMTRRIMKAMNVTFNMWQSHFENGLDDYWRKELEAAGMNDANAGRLREGFCRSWETGQPTLHAFTRWVKENAVEKGNAYRTARDQAERLGVLGSVGTGEIIQRMKDYLRGVKEEQQRAVDRTALPEGKDVSEQEIPF